jgi:hypothetical protein
VGNVKERGRLGDHPHEVKRSAPQASCSASERWGEAAGSAKRSLTATGTTFLEDRQIKFLRSGAECERT